MTFGSVDYTGLGREGRPASGRGFSTPGAAGGLLFFA
jgi:hypothetical protein